MDDEKCAKGGEEKDDRNRHATIFRPIIKLDIVVELEEVKAVVIIVEHLRYVLELVLLGNLQGQLAFF